MTIGRIIINNLRQRGLTTLLTTLSIALGVALIVAALVIKNATVERFRLGYSGYDLVVGAKGSPLQLVLNVIYNIDTSPGNIPYELYEELRADPRVSWIVPYSVGDNYAGFRIVGTTDEFLKKFEPRPGQSLTLAAGRIFDFEEANLKKAMKAAMERGAGHISAKEDQIKKAANVSHDHTHHDHSHDHHHHNDHAHHGHEHHTHDHSAGERNFEAVLGSQVARETGLKVGSTFVATHGITPDSEDSEHKHHDESPWTVVGVLHESGTPVDRAIYINLDSFYHIEGHVIESSHDHKDDSAGRKDGVEPSLGEVSSLALKAKSPVSVWSLRKDLNKRSNSQAAVPAEEIRKLFQIVGNVDRILILQAVLIVVVALVGTSLALFNSMAGRKQDIAVMRALGAHRYTISSIIVGEAMIISLMGGLLGLALGHVLVQMANPLVQQATGMSISGLDFHLFEAGILLATLLLGLLCGLGPAASAYRTSVASSLAD
jgi:putative ABC transport system permease protein